MFILFVTYLILTTALTHTADDALPSFAQSMEQLQLKEPKAPEEFMLQLRIQEAQAAHDVPHKFTVFYEHEIYHPDEIIESFDNIKKYMQRYGFDEYYDYFLALASSSKLSDEQKLKKKFVMIPFFKQLAQKSVKEKGRAYHKFFMKQESCCYAFTRLLASAFYKADCSQNSYYFPMIRSFEYPDMAMKKILLQQNYPLDIKEFCVSLDDANLLFTINPNFRRKHWFNEFGGLWFYALDRSIGDYNFNIPQIIGRLIKLFQHSCYYNQESINIILKGINESTPPRLHGLSYLESREPVRKMRKEACKEVTALVKKDQASRKNIVFGLHQRALTGKPLQNMKVHLNHCYERALHK